MMGQPDVSLAFFPFPLGSLLCYGARGCLFLLADFNRKKGIDKKGFLDYNAVIKKGFIGGITMLKWRPRMQKMLLVSNRYNATYNCRYYESSGGVRRLGALVVPQLWPEDMEEAEPILFETVYLN